MPTLDDTPPRRARKPAQDLGHPFLIWRRAGGPQQLFALHAGLRRVTIGRGPANDVPLAWDTEVARVHAQLERVGGEWTLVDDGLSRDGTSVNGTRIAGRHRLKDGDTIEVGKTKLAFRTPTRARSRKAKDTAKRAGAPELSTAQRRVLEALCRPYQESEFAQPATNQAIAEELFLSADAVKAHLRALTAAFGVDELPQNQRRSSLAMRALQLGLVR